MKLKEYKNRIFNKSFSKYSIKCIIHTTLFMLVADILFFINFLINGTSWYYALAFDIVTTITVLPITIITLILWEIIERYLKIKKELKHGSNNTNN